MSEEKLNNRVRMRMKKKQNNKPHFHTASHSVFVQEMIGLSNQL